MQRRLRSLVIALVALGAMALGGCSGPPETIVIPTIAVLPTLPPTTTLTPAAPATETPLLPSVIPSATASRTPAPPTATFTVTPSLTITNTPAPTRPSPTPTATQPQAGALGGLGVLVARATVLPQPTTIPGSGATPTFMLTPPGFATPPSGIPTFTPLPLAPSAPVNCANPTPGGLAAMLASDASLSAALGCPLGTPLTMAAAAQVFERGTMYYLQGPPKSIYVLTFDGRFSRFDDTWVEGVDAVSGGENPPPGFLEPIRGFGKVWRVNPSVRAALGWAVATEAGGQAAVQLFERGRALYLPLRGETVMLLDEALGQSGSWRAFPGGF